MITSIIILEIIKLNNRHVFTGNEHKITTKIFWIHINKYMNYLLGYSKIETFEELFLSLEYVNLAAADNNVTSM